MFPNALLEIECIYEIEFFFSALVKFSDWCGENLQIRYWLECLELVLASFVDFCTIQLRRVQ